MKHLLYLSLGLLLCLAAGDGLAAPAAETAGQVLAKLAKMTPERRQKTLVEKAKVEGEVSFYSSLQAQQIDPFIQAFRKRYPFVKVNPYRVSGNRQVIKIQTEMNAGNHLFDVTNGSAEQASALKKIGAIDPYASPQREFFSGSNKDKEGYFTSLYAIPIVLGYNTNLVKRAEAPRSYEDLLHPKWKGNMFLDDEAYEWFAVLLKHFGREKGLQYMRNLAKQDLRMVRGRTAQSQLLAAGERPLAIALSGHTVWELKTKGAPLEGVILDPYFAQANKLPCAPPSRGGAVYRLVSFGRRTIDDHNFWPRRREKRSQTAVSGTGREGELFSGRGFYRADSGSKRQRIQSDLLGALVHHLEDSIGPLRV
jgi:iron(III) transport system substrate-binding protein